MSAKLFLEKNYPIWAKIKDDNQTKKVIIEVATEYAQEQIKLLNVACVSVPLPTPATEIWLQANELNLTEFTKWYKNNVGYER